MRNGNFWQNFFFQDLRSVQKNICIFFAAGNLANRVSSRLQSFAKQRPQDFTHRELDDVLEVISSKVGKNVRGAFFSDFNHSPYDAEDRWYIYFFQDVLIYMIL